MLAFRLSTPVGRLNGGVVTLGDTVGEPDGAEEM